MYTLQESKISSRGGYLKIGDKVGVCFNHGKLEHPVYGTAIETSGVIPLLIPYGDYPFPSIIYNDERLDNLVKELRKEYGYLWEDELDDVIESKLRDFVILAAFLFATPTGDDIESPKMRFNIMGTIIGFVLDDMIDSIDFGEMGISYKDSKMVTDRAVRMFDGESPDKGNADMPLLIPKLAPFLRYVREFKLNLDNYSSNSKERSQRVMTGMSNAMVGSILVLENNSKDKADEGFSSETLLYLHGHQGGFVSFLEYCFITNNDEDVSDEIREDVLFRRFGECLANIAGHMNAIFGIGRDMRLDQVNDTPILTQVVNKGVTLQNAFNSVAESMYTNLQDVRVASKKLKERYSEIPAVISYIRCAERLMDGHFYAYMHVHRYGNLNLKIQKFE